MMIRMWCTTHHCEVVSAEGALLHWIPLDKGKVKTGNHFCEWELDEANLYCTGADVKPGEPDHEFHYSIYTGQNKTTKQQNKTTKGLK